MRKILLTILIAGIGNVGFTQDYKKDIEEEFLEYFNLLVTKEFERSMDYILPEFFELIPREQMVSAMQQAFNDPSIQIELISPRVNNIDDTQEIEGRFYSLLNYSNQMNMKMPGEEGETDDEKKGRIDYMRETFEGVFGKENVAYNEDDDAFEIQAKKDVYAISADGKTGWKFLAVEKEQKVILEKLLPEQLIDEIYNEADSK